MCYNIRKSPQSVWLRRNFFGGITMKLISWNVNGFRACLQKGFEDFFKAADADIFCLQETKMQPGQTDFAPKGYTYTFTAP